MVRQTRTSTVHSDSAGSSNARPLKTRRSHRKSRNGCIECKHRHMRCDERQPTCANCETADRACSYPPINMKKKQQQERDERSDVSRDPSTGPTAAQPPPYDVSSHSITVHSESARQSHLSLPESGQQFPSSLYSPGPALALLAEFEFHPPMPSSGASPTQLSNAGSSRADCLPGLPHAPGVGPIMNYTPQHLILLRYAEMVPNFTGSSGNVVNIAIRYAVDSSYLLDEILAFTAFHLAYLYPGSAVQLGHLATELQTRALASFTRVTERVPKDDAATAVPRFLFSAILGRHVLADTLAHYRGNFQMFITRLVECFNLNRGIKSVTPRAQDYLSDSEVGPFLNAIVGAQKAITSPGIECDPLTRLMEKSDLNEASKRACKQAIVVLQRSFDICRRLDREDYPQCASVFSVGIESDFVDALRKHQPEALIILAYYGVLLHRCRTFWAFADAGAPMVRAIAAHVGGYWQEVLAWPLYALKADGQT